MIFTRYKLKRPAGWSKKKTTRLVALDPQDPTFTQRNNSSFITSPSSDALLPVEKHFQDAWKHPKKPRPRINAIFEIVLTDEMLVSFLRYRYELNYGSGSCCSLLIATAPWSKSLACLGTQTSNCYFMVPIEAACLAMEKSGLDCVIRLSVYSVL